MDKFLISPDDCLILKAFKDSKSLRDAAALLGCDPAGLARHVQRISSQYGFLQKVNNRWQVTAHGLGLVAWTESSIQSQRAVMLAKNSLRLATTMWFSEEVVVPSLAKLQKAFNGEMAISLTVPKKSFELALIDGTVDFVIVCHPPENPEIEHRQIVEEKWSLIAPTAWKGELSGQRPLEELKDRPFISHSEMNLDLFMPEIPKLRDSGVAIDNLIGIRSAVCSGLGWSLVPRALVVRHVKDRRLLEIPFDIPIRDRKICLWWLRSRFDSRRLASRMAAWIKEAC